MYLDKDQFVLHRLAELGDSVPAYLRFDLRHLTEFPDSASDIERISEQAINSPEQLRESWPRPTIAPFFKSNLTTNSLSSSTQICDILETSSASLKLFQLSVKNTPCFELLSLSNFRTLFVQSIEVGLRQFMNLILKTLDGTVITRTESDQIVLAPWMQKFDRQSDNKEVERSDGIQRPAFRITTFSRDCTNL